jgi:hypothetical protein
LQCDEDQKFVSTITFHRPVRGEKEFVQPHTAKSAQTIIRGFRPVTALFLHLLSRYVPLCPLRIAMTKRHAERPADEQGKRITIMRKQ